MKINVLVLFYFLLFFYSRNLSAQLSSLFIKKLTAINPTSYTDVIFIGARDTALISTFSGRIAIRIKDKPKEKVIANVNDEIYSLAYNPINNEIAASTLENGIIILDRKFGNVRKQLKLRTTWSVNISYSDDFSYLFTQDQKGNRYLWEVKRGYQEIPISAKMPAGRMVRFNKNGQITIISSKKMIVWDIKNDTTVSETDIVVVRLGDIDTAGNYLSVDFNECSKYNIKANKSEFVLKHPNWLRDIKDYPNYKSLIKTNPIEFTEDGLLIMQDYSMQMTMVRFAKNYIYTASIDRSIRKWNKRTGELLTSLTGHSGTVNKIKVNGSETQLVSIDLKGGIKFWNID